MLNERATDVRFIVFSETNWTRTVLATLHTERGAKATLTRRLNKGEMGEAPCYGWQRQELVDGAWIDC